MRSALFALALFGCLLPANAWSAGFSCVIPASGAGPLNAVQMFDAGKSVLIGASNGLFRFDIGKAVVSPVSGVDVSPVPGREIQRVLQLYGVPGGILVDTDFPGILRYDIKSESVVALAGMPFRWVRHLLEIPGGLLIDSSFGLFHYDFANTSLAPVGGLQGPGINRKDYSWLDNYAGAILLLVQGEGLFEFDQAKNSIVPVPGGKRAKDVARIPGGALVFFDGSIAQYEPRAKSMRPVASADIGRVTSRYNHGDSVLVHSDRGLFRYDAQTHSMISLVGLGTDRIHWMDEPVEGGVLIDTERGLFRLDLQSNSTTLISPLGGRFTSIDTSIPGQLLLVADEGAGLFRYDYRTQLFARIDHEIGRIQDWRSFANVVWLVTDRDLYRYDARANSFEPMNRPEIYKAVNASLDEIDGQLLGIDQGLFFYSAQEKTMTPVRGATTGRVSALHQLGGEVLVGAERGVFLAVSRPLGQANVRLTNLGELQGSPANPSQDIPFQLLVEHPCAPVASELGLTVVPRPPRGRDQAPIPLAEGVSSSVRLPFAHRVDEAGDWGFRVFSQSELLGKPLTVSFQRALEQDKFLTFFARVWRWLIGVPVVLLTTINLLIFWRARWSPAAWRIATDDSWGSSALRLPMLILRHSRLAQLWILDFYVRKRHSEVSDRSVQFLPMPLTNPEGRSESSITVVKSLARIRRRWIQGGIGMGKTTLIHHLEDMHFRTAPSSYEAFRRNGYILVRVSARRYADPTVDDKRDPSWVISCVRSVLSANELVFDNENLLRAILRSGTLGIAIDGLNEVSRSRSVDAFADEFPNTPLLITSHEPANDRFQSWRLPESVGDFVEQLLILYLGVQDGGIVFDSVQKKGLAPLLRSGYDVRLLADLVHDDPATTIPNDRISLYREVVNAAWPASDDEQRRQEQGQLESAAWRAMSEREPNEDKRRLRPDQDAPSALLNLLAGVPQSAGKNVRLVRASGNDFEFIHDQMNAYLAARWFAAHDRAASELVEMLRGSKIWNDTPESRRVIWHFASAMLDRERLVALLDAVQDNDLWDSLRRTLEEAARRFGLRSALKPVDAVAE